MDVAELVAHQVHARRSAIAISSAERALGYEELGSTATRIARLLARHGAGPDDVVGLHVPRGADFAAAVLGVLYAGAAYLALDVNAPRHRNAELLALAGCRFVVASRPDAAADLAPPGVPVLPVDPVETTPATPVPVRAHADSLAYVVFTSGSTGEPKPVAVPRRALANHAGVIAERYRLNRDDRVLQFAAVTFDVYAEELFPTLVAGARIVTCPDATLPPVRLSGFLAEHGVTVVNLPTPYWTQWTRDLEAAPHPLPECLRLVVIGSDAGHTDALDRWRGHTDVPVVNAYGLSESTVTATVAELTGPNLPNPLPIGNPVAGVEALVLDAALRPVPDGERGELYLGGECLARGYPGRAALTAARFVPHPRPRVPGARLYRTGDVVRRVPGHGLLYLGRADRQVQVRGHRVEPLQVEAALAEHPDVLQASVQPLRDPMTDEVALAAYLTVRDPHRVPTVRAIREHLRNRLPDYAHPTTVSVLDALPLLPTGKVDAARLPAPSRGRRRDMAYVPPAGELHERLAALWCATLGVDRVGVTDDLFELGGHSLTATRIATAIAEQERVAVSGADVLATPTIAMMADLVRERRDQPVPLPPLRGADRTSAVLSIQQEQVLFLNRLAPDSIAYHTPTTIRVTGELDLDVLDRVVTELACRHAIFRTTYPDAGGEHRQVVHPPEPVRVRRMDLTSVPEVDRPAEAERLVEEELHRPFDVTRLPLLRWTAIRLARDEHELVLVEHHLVHDGWSFALLMRELKALYNAFAAGAPSPLPELNLQYHDYAVWQRAALDSAEPDAALPRQLAYWRHRLTGLPEPLTLPPDRPRPQVQTHKGRTLRIELPPTLPTAVREFGRTERVTMFTAMFSAFAVLMHRSTGTEDVCVGSAFACRQVPGTQDLIGMFVNPVLLRCPVRPDSTFHEVVASVRVAVDEASRNQEYPFPALVRALNPDRDPSGLPMTRILFSANDSPLPELDLGAAYGTVFERGNGSAKMDLDVVVVPRAESRTSDAETADERVMLLWEYNADLFDESTMLRLADRYLRVLAAAVAAPATRVIDLPLLTDAEHRQVLGEWSSTGDPDIALAPILTTVLSTARTQPDRAAVVAGGHAVDYGTLVTDAQAFAGRLLDLGVGPGDVVGVVLPRGADLVVAELGVLMAGAAFAPLDPTTPSARIDQCRDDAGIRYTVVDSPSSADELSVRGRPGPSRTADIVPGPLDAPAYVVFTSGSTGRPKGVMVSHRSLANFVGTRLRGGLGAGDRTTMVASPGFDASIGEIWSSLAAGATIHVPDERIRLTPVSLRDWLCADAITVTDLPTALAEELLALDWPPDTPLRTMITGGDVLTRRPDPGTPFTVLNEYGPTEATVAATAGVVAPGGDEQRPPDIGRPLEGVTAYLLDDELRPVAPGVPGELHLGGAATALGYVGQGGLTAERFVPDPFSARPGARMYRTGDRCRHLPDGRIEFLGRSDDQVQVRGFRIEPAEIAAALHTHPAVTGAHVSAIGGRLVAYLTGVETPSAELRAHVGATLPAYMVPADLVWLPRFPLTPNGKVDRAALPAPRPATTSSPPPASGTVEHAIAAIWRDVLRVDRVGTHDNFFDLGGHSLLVGEVHRRMITDLRADLPLVALFQYPTVSALANRLSAGDGAETPAGPPVVLRRAHRDRDRRARARQRAADDGTTS